MLNSTKEKLQALYAGGRQLGTDGQLHAIDMQTRVDKREGEAIAHLHRTTRPSLSVEIGLAYGFSTLYILDAMAEGDYGRHIAIDPSADTFWHGIGLQAVKDTDLGERFNWIKGGSADALPALIRSGERAQFVFIDGCHHFEYALADFFLSDQLLDMGGLIVLDDMWMPAIQRVVSYVSTNMCWYKRITVDHENLAAFMKVGQDSRSWDHFEEF